MTKLFELLTATCWFWIFSIGFLISILLSTYILFFTKYWMILSIYILWIWYDRKTCEKGGRPIQWIKQWSWWHYAKSYFKFKLIVDDDDVKLDEKKNYLFACFPHGVLPVSMFASINGYEKLFSKHKPYTTVLNIQFWMPIIRELFLSIGAVSVSAASIKYLLKPSNNGGNIVSILIGGGEESQYCKPGKYKIILKKRKGFVKMALQMGSPLVPVFTFGETDVFDQINIPGFNIIINLIKTITNVVIVLPFGTYFVCPNRVSITTVVGKPIHVKQMDNPTSEDIEQLHEQFVESLNQLFEKYKYKYVKNPDNTVLEIV